MELAVHRQRKTNYRWPNKIERSLREIQPRRSEVTDLFEVAVQSILQPTEAEASFRALKGADCAFGLVYIRKNRGSRPTGWWLFWVMPL